MENRLCQKCGRESASDSVFCTSCGARIESAPAAATAAEQPPAKTIDWKWVAKSALIIGAAWFICIIIAIIIYASGGGNLEDNAAALPYLGVGAFIGIFLGSMFSAYRSPGVTLKEPAIGAVIVILLINLISALFTGKMEGFNIFGFAILYLVGLGGAKLGEVIQEKTRKV